MSIPIDPHAESGDAIMAEDGVFPGLPRIFADCVDADGPPPTDRPWIHGAFVYASDQSIIVRVPALVVGPGPCKAYAKRRGVRHPNADKIFRKSLRNDRIPVGLPRTCREPTVRCPACPFADAAYCLVCRGSGRVGNHMPVALGGSYFSVYYVARLVRNGVRKLFVPPGPPADRDSASAATFRIGRVEGLLMPRLRPDEGEEMWASESGE